MGRLLALVATFLVSTVHAQTSLLNYLNAQADYSTLNSVVVNFARSDWAQQGPFTVFAPKNAVFSSVSVSSLTTTADASKLLVNGHIVYGAYTKSNLQDGMTLQALNGAFLEVYKTPSGTVFVENMEIRGSSDGTTVTTNGVNSIVHDVNDVNIPNIGNSRRTIFQALAAKPSKFLSFKLAILRSGINGILSQISSTNAMYTVIAPTNAQLTGSVLDPATITALDDARLASTLRYGSLRLGARSFQPVHSSPPTGNK